MLRLLITSFVVFMILLFSELWARWRHPHGELSRKFIHITIGSFVAFWPFFLTWNQIRLLCLGFVVTVCISKWFHIFRAIHSVQRPTWGEVYFALVVGLLTFVTQSKAIYAAALLQMALADGLAAVVGVRYGRKHRYHMWGHEKTIIGTCTFFVASALLLIGYSVHSNHLQAAYIAVLAAVATLAENIAVAGLDNLLVPLLIAFVLEHLR